MKNLLRIVSAAGLLLTVIPSLLVLYQQMEWATHAQLMALGMILWFGSAPFWIKKGG